MTVKIGIYCIYFEALENKYYIGCSIDVDKRIKEHISALVRGAHHNQGLQSAYNKYGKVSCELVEECDIHKLYEREIFYIKEFNSYLNGFNRTTGGEGGGYGEGNPAAKHTEAEYLQVLRMLAYTNDPFAVVSMHTGVGINIIKHISRLSTHSYLEKLDPVAYAIVKSKHNTRDNSAATKGVVYPVILDTQGNEYSVANVHQFAEEHNLQYQNLHKVLTGKRISHKGWKLKCK